MVNADCVCLASSINGEQRTLRTQTNLTGRVLQERQAVQTVPIRPTHPPPLRQAGQAIPEPQLQARQRSVHEGPVSRRVNSRV